ncbi:hypothetical protein PCANC_07368 [Puccinia coronata f. sp. avenae]|uniref:Uncharacterized protein n=1 Tax=Puccinia coronata f. sp. avenae TaxID=200324 RepID=A0A2N5T5C0_9BASI|nr:hypothetical protein PCANC_07368 [Puccinia coronata f. sp. avenae]
MISTTLITALLLASAANALESYDTQPQRQASYLSPQANYGLKNAPNAVVPASHPVASTGLTQTHTTPSNDNTGDSRDANPSRSSGSHKNGKLAKRQFQQAGPGSEHNAADPRPQDGGTAPTNSSQWGGPAMPAGAQMNNSQPGGPVMPAGAMRVAQTNASQWGGPAMPAGPQMNYSQPGGPVMPAVNRAVRSCYQVESEWPKRTLVNRKVRSCQEVLSIKELQVLITVWLHLLEKMLRDDRNLNTPPVFKPETLQLLLDAKRAEWPKRSTVNRELRSCQQVLSNKELLVHIPVWLLPPQKIPMDNRFILNTLPVFKLEPTRLQAPCLKKGAPTGASLSASNPAP